MLDTGNTWSCGSSHDGSLKRQREVNQIILDTKSALDDIIVQMGRLRDAIDGERDTYVSALLVRDREIRELKGALNDRPG